MNENTNKKQQLFFSTHELNARKLHATSLYYYYIIIYIIFTKYF